MKLVARLAGFLNKRQAMRSVDVSLRSGTYFVVTIHGSKGSEPCIAAGPVETLALDAPHQDLGDAIFRGLKATRHDYPYPANQQEWSQVIAPLLSAAGCKSWGTYAKRASSLRVDQTAEQIRVLPCIREKTSFAPVAGRELELKAPSAPELGEIIAKELAFAAQRDGAA